MDYIETAKRDRGAVELGTIIDFMLQWIESGASMEEASEKAKAFASGYATTKTELKIANDLINRIAKI